LRVFPPQEVADFVVSAANILKKFQLQWCMRDFFLHFTPNIYDS